MKYANVDNEGYILGFYDPEINDTIPEPNHEIDDATWEGHLNGNLVKWDDGWVSYTYDPIKDMSIEEVKERKYVEIWQESDKQNTESETVFFVKGSETTRNNDRLKKKNARINNKQLKGQTVSPEEEEFIDQWDDCMDWQDSTNDIADQAEDTVELMTDKYAVDTYDVVNDPGWQEPFAS